MHSLPLLTTVAVALGYSLVGGIVARRVGLPTIVGYLLAGVAVGPFSPGFVGDTGTIRQLAELGVILLMFGVGLHFSLTDLWQVRQIAIPGALSQMAVMSFAGYMLATAWGWQPGGAWLFGVAASVASTVVLMRNLMDGHLLHSAAGRAAVGWSVVEDLATVGILVVLPAMAGASGHSGSMPILMAGAKAVGFIALMFLAGTRVIPFVLGRVAHTRSRELFVLMALTVAVGTALGAAELFGVSLALGAFIAGIVVAESPFSLQVSADLLPFREAFAVLFFVSVGMLVNPAYLAAHWTQVVALSMLIVAGKAVLTALTVFVLPYPVHTALVLAAGRSQIGEFSFIIGQAGVTLGLLSPDNYSLILAGAIVSITVNPLMFALVKPAERRLRSFPRVWRVLDRHGFVAPPPPPVMRDHVVIVGCGRVGRHLTEVLGQQHIPRLVVESDAGIMAKLQSREIPVLYGDAANSEILQHAALPVARALIITVPDDNAAMTMIRAARRLAPGVSILARASSWKGARQLLAAGARHIVRPELEGGVEMVRQTLLDLDFPADKAQALVDEARREQQ
jgi:CPA2 family monovalent cation:H+ antiporter-2